MNSVKVHNEVGAADIETDEKAIQQTAQLVLEQEQAANQEVSIVLVAEERMKELNERYRGKAKDTNVLSFAYEEGVMLGEVLLSPAQIRKEAAEYGITFRGHLMRVLIHGMLHLLGYDHEQSTTEAKAMEQKEEQYLGMFDPSF